MLYREVPGQLYYCLYERAYPAASGIGTYSEEVHNSCRRTYYGVYYLTHGSDMTADLSSWRNREKLRAFHVAMKVASQAPR